MNKEVIELLQEIRNLPGFTNVTRAGVIALTNDETDQAFKISTTSNSRITVSKVGTTDGLVFPSNSTSHRLEKTRDELRRLGLPLQTANQIRKSPPEVPEAEQAAGQTEPSAKESSPPPPNETLKENPMEREENEINELVDLILSDSDGVTKNLADAALRRAAAAGARGFEEGVGRLRLTFFDWDGDIFELLREQWVNDEGVSLLPDRSHPASARLQLELFGPMRRTGAIRRTHVPDGHGGGNPVWRIRDNGNGDAYVAQYEREQAAKAAQIEAEDPPVVSDAEAFQEPELHPEEASKETPEETPVEASESDRLARAVSFLTLTPPPVGIGPKATPEEDQPEPHVDAAPSPVGTTPVKAGGDMRVTYVKCDECPYTDLPQSVTVHINRTIGPHPQQAYPCPKCPVVKVTLAGYTKHQSVKHGETGLICPECLVYFPVRGLLMTHTNKEHPVKKLEAAAAGKELETAAAENGTGDGLRRRARRDTHPPVAIPAPENATPKPSPPPGYFPVPAPARTINRPATIMPAVLDPSLASGQAPIPIEALQAEVLRMFAEYPTMRAQIDDLRAKLDEAVTARGAAESALAKVRKAVGL